MIPCDNCGLDISHCPLYPNACGKISDYNRYISAKLSARDKEWVEWVVTNAEVEGDTIILPGKLWRERRKEIGL